jgi:hypothetical protein
MSAGASERRADIDHLRVGALLLLIVYHVLLVYSAEWWRVESTHQGPWADYFVSALTPWRMALVFAIGGMAARFMMEKLTPGGFVMERASKLLTAFVFAVVVLIPLQRYVRMDNENAAAVNYLDFMLLRARYAVNDHGVWLPDFANAWFLPYLFIYSAVAALFWRFTPRVFVFLQRLVEAAPIWAPALVGMIWFALVETFVIPHNPVSGLLFPDLGGHLRFAPVFLFGLLIGKSNAFTGKLLNAKVAFWLLGAALLTIALTMQWRMGEIGRADPLLRDIWRALHGVYAGAMLFGALGFGMWALAKPSNWLTWASDAILPVYLMHQTVLVVAADALVRHRLPLAYELPILFTVTLLIPVVIYSLVVRYTPWLRVLFGLRPRARPWRSKTEASGQQAAGEPAHRL